MTPAQVAHRKVADAVVEQIETLVMEGSLGPGVRLPAERELARRFGVSRPSVREAIQRLAARGILVSQQGGGTYVAESLGSSFTDPLLTLLAERDVFRQDVLEFRHALEGLAAYYAALRATAADRAALQQRFDELVATYADDDPEREAAADAAFHLGIAEAAHNAVLIHSMRGLFSMLERTIVDNLGALLARDAVREDLYRQHAALLGAILEGDPERAQQRSHEHLVFVEENVAELHREEVRAERASRRRILSSEEADGAIGR